MVHVRTNMKTVFASFFERWVAKLLGRMLATTALWIRIQTSLKNTKMGDIRKGVAIKLSSPPKKRLFKNINHSFHKPPRLMLNNLCNWLTYISRLNILCCAQRRAGEQLQLGGLDPGDG